MGKEISMFGNIEIEKSKFYCHKTPILLGDVDVEKVLVCNRIYFDKKNFNYFIGYSNDNQKVKPLHVMLP